jgi:hypothetical protein
LTYVIATLFVAKGVATKQANLNNFQKCYHHLSLQAKSCPRLIQRDEQNPRLLVAFKSIVTYPALNSRDRIVVSTPRCGRGNPGSNPGHGNIQSCHGRELFYLLYDCIAAFLDKFSQLKMCYS